MKRTGTLLTLLCLTAPLGAAPSLESAFSQAVGGVRQVRHEMSQAAVARAELPPRESFARFDACWSRPPHAEADALGLPRRFCLGRVGVSVPQPYDLPFVDGSAIIVEGEPAAGRFHIGGGARYADHWNIVGDLFTRRGEPSCGKLTTTFAAVYVDIDLKGDILPATPEVRGFLMDGSSLCRQPAKSVEILYAKEG
ncbi:MAG: hypothetical protein HY926_11070 [Elusimicrobia bacterium]|nr:hypothetical protein [Elusimicrobiota bacterium]